MSASEREDLQELLSIPGWQRFVTHMLNEYADGPGYRARMKMALSKDLPEALLTERMAIEIERVLIWPSRRLEEVEGEGEERE